MAVRVARARFKYDYDLQKTSKTDDSHSIYNIRHP